MSPNFLLRITSLLLVTAILLPKHFTFTHDHAHSISGHHHHHQDHDHSVLHDSTGHLEMVVSSSVETKEWNENHNPNLSSQRSGEHSHDIDLTPDALMRQLRITTSIHPLADQNFYPSSYFQGNIYHSLFSRGPPA